jgi:abequosyltransferase
MDRIKNHPLVSICIPTRNRVDILKNTLDSIYSDTSVDRSMFEVVVSDNSSTNEMDVIKGLYESMGNIRFVKSDCVGFMNSINALDHGNGVFLKLLNDYSYFFEDSFQRLINFFQKNQERSISVSFTSGMLKYNEIRSFDSFESFMFNLSYYSSWSSAFCIRRTAFLELRSIIDFDGQFPHTSLVLADRNSEAYIVNDLLYFKNMTVPKKGGTDLFKDFSVTYLGLIKSLIEEKIISNKTYNLIKKRLLYDFLVIWYFNTKIKPNNYTYYVSNTYKRILVNYSIYDFISLIFLAYIQPFKFVINRLGAYLSRGLNFFKIK